MSFLDNTGLAYFYSKLKEKFIRSVTAGSDILTPDMSGNITITNVATANNLTSPDAQTSYGTFIYRTSGGSASLTSGEAQLMYVDGNMEIIGRIPENFDITATNEIIVSYDANQWRDTINTSGTYYFRYTCPTSSIATSSWSASGVWTRDGIGEISLSAYGLNVSNIVDPSISTTINSGVVDPSINTQFSGDIAGVTVTLSTFASQIQTSGSYQFIYNSTANSWQYLSENVSLDTYGISITGTPSNNDTIVIDYIAGGSGLSGATVVPSTFASQIQTSGLYQFIYNMAENSWQYLSENVLLNTYGISITGAPNDGDSVTINFVNGTPDSVITVIYTAFERGTIYIPQPTGFSATGFNQFDKNTMVINNATFENGIIASGVNTIAYCHAKGGVDNGYVAYSEGDYIVRIGWCAALPEIGSAVVTTGASVATPIASIPFNEDGYVVVEVTNTSDLCIHPKWSGRSDTDYAEYVAPSVITFPTHALNPEDPEAQGEPLPLHLYGMPRIGAVPDTLDLDAGVYVQRIGRLANTPANMSVVLGYGTDYDYDNDYIYYVLPQSVTYQVDISPNYIVDDFGTEEFLGTEIACTAQMLYSQNLRDKLRTDVLTISAQIPTLTNTELSNIAHNIGLALYPVGSIYMSADSKSPALIFGGTWEQITGRFLLAAGGNYGAGTTGGEASVTLAAGHLPSHRHTIPALSGTAASAGSHTHAGAKGGAAIWIDTTENSSGINNGEGFARSTDYSNWWTAFKKGIFAIASSGAHTHSVTTTASNTGYYGNGSAHNNMPPYLAVYVWKRTA